MQTNHVWFRRAGRFAIALCAAGLMVSAVQAGGSRISFAGAIVVPTCDLDSSSVQQAQQASSGEVRSTCPGSVAGSTRAYDLRITQLATAMIDPRVNTYFQNFMTSSGIQLDTRTYQ